ncbi:hypothetical protein TNCV_4576891 [Trichonephila clavipes]|nr:hypothetical protein TNCV_4576891 [Trichonephila clavipes]
MDVRKCIVPSRHGGTLNSRRAASPLKIRQPCANGYTANQNHERVHPFLHSVLHERNEEMDERLIKCIAVGDDYVEK